MRDADVSKSLIWVTRPMLQEPAIGEPQAKTEQRQVSCEGCPREEAEGIIERKQPTAPARRTMTGVYELFVIAYRNGFAVELKFHTPTK